MILSLLLMACDEPNACSDRVSELPPQVEIPENDTCISPWQNLEEAYEPAASGCACDTPDEGYCVADEACRLVALVCDDGFWLPVLDGPCGT